MSLWFYLEETQVVSVYDSNMTHNLARMAREAGIYEALWCSEQFKAAFDLIRPLEAGIAAMEADPERFKPLSASNGWGTYEQFLPWVKEVLEACRANPFAQPRSSG